MDIHTADLAHPVVVVTVVPQGAGSPQGAMVGLQDSVVSHQVGSPGAHHLEVVNHSEAVRAHSEAVPAHSAGVQDSVEAVHSAPVDPLEVCN